MPQYFILHQQHLQHSDPLLGQDSERRKIWSVNSQLLQTSSKPTLCPVSWISNLEEERYRLRYIYYHNPIKKYLSSYPAVHCNHIFNRRFKVCCCIITLHGIPVSISLRRDQWGKKNEEEKKEKEEKGKGLPLYLSSGTISVIQLTTFSYSALATQQKLLLF